MSGGRLQTQARGRRQQHQKLPFDVLVDIAARTDPATLVRCAATCLDMRHRIKDDPGLRSRLRLRHGHRFVPPLLRGHLVYGYEERCNDQQELFVVDTIAVDATKLRRHMAGFGSPLVSRDGLVLTRTADQELRVCDPATGSSHTLPSVPTFPVDVANRQPDPLGMSYVLLVGGDDDEGATTVGRHFRVVKAYLDLSQHHLQLQTFSSEQSMWGRCIKIRAPIKHGSRLTRGLGKALVIGGVVYWLCVVYTGAYIIKLHAKATHLTVAMLPKSFPHDGEHDHLLATSTAGGSPIVLVTDRDKILAWALSKQTAKWQQRPHVVIETTEAILRFHDRTGGSCKRLTRPVRLNIVWFAERSGTVLINTCCGFFWVDLLSMEIVRRVSNHGVTYMSENIRYEMNLADWVPAFSSIL